MTKVIIADRTHDVLEERLKEAGFEVRVEPDHDYESLVQAAQGCDGLVVRSKVIIDIFVIKLEIICNNKRKNLFIIYSLIFIAIISYWRMRIKQQYFINSISIRFKLNSHFAG